MSDAKGSKLNKLQQKVPEGLLVDAAWLEKHGYAIGLRNKYVQSGWLQALARGVYRRPLSDLRSEAADNLPWELVVVSLQTLLEWPGVVGGRTALGLEGYGHYLSPEGPQEVHLYGDRPPPGWLQKLPLKASFKFHRDSRLFPPEKRGKGLDAVVVDIASGTTTPVSKGLRDGPAKSPWSPTGWPLTCSAPERATLEMLDQLPDGETFHQVDMVFQSLTNLNPKTCQRLLEACKSVKVKRLFLWFAQRHGLRWALQLERSRIDLGAGNRVIAKNGRLNKEFLITVPEDSDGPGG